MKKSGKKNSVLVVGAGVAGMQAAIDCAQLGLKVYLLEKASSIGGHMAQLDKTFPTNDCSMCILSPRMHEVNREENIEIFSYCRLESISGEPGHFHVSFTRLPRFVNEIKCIGCGTCTAKCPSKIPNAFNLSRDMTKTIHQLYPQAVPAVPVIEPEHCLYFKKGKCKVCEKICPSKAIDFEQQTKPVSLEVGAIILATGFETFDPGLIPDYHYGDSPDILTSLEFERVLSPTGPFRGELLRFSDEKTPRRIAFIQCTGSRDVSQNRPYCSGICCLISFKQAMLASSRKGVDKVSIFYIDRRAQEKEGERYLRRLQDNEKIELVKGKVAKIIPQPNGTFVLHYSDGAGIFRKQTADMVVLAVGVERPVTLAGGEKTWGIRSDKWGFVIPGNLPVETSRSGIFACGIMLGPQSIPGSVLEAEAAASGVAQILLPDTVSHDVGKRKELVAPEDVRLGIFICRCGTNIAGVVDTEAVTEFAGTLPRVIWAQENLFTCSSDATREMVRIVKEKRITRLLVASCTPRSHLPIFQDVMIQAGLNPGLVTMANIREQCAWVHKETPERATEKAKRLVEAAASRLLGSHPLPFLSAPITKRALVIGGGISGLSAAISLAEQGIAVSLVEKSNRLGGRSLTLAGSPDGIKIDEFGKQLVSQAEDQSLISVYLESSVEQSSGAAGNFRSVIRKKDGSEEEIEHGAVIVATGAELLKPEGLLGYGEIEGVWTQAELARVIREVKRLEDDDPGTWVCPSGEDARAPDIRLPASDLASTISDFRTLRPEIQSSLPGAISGLTQMRRLCMIQCVGSRTDERPYCSRICCSTAILHALILKKINPHLEITIFYRDIRTYGFYEFLYQEAREKGIVFIPYSPENPPNISQVRLGRKRMIKVEVLNPYTGESICVTSDRVVLSEATIPNKDQERLATLLKIPLSADGFFMEKHLKLAPAETQVEGIYVCGQAHYPKMVLESAIQGQAVTAKAGALLRHDMRETYASTVTVDHGSCIRCLTCVRVCPYGIPHFKEGRIHINQLQCQGCGICAAECPGKAIQPDQGRDSQAFEELAKLAR